MQGQRKSRKGEVKAYGTLATAVESRGKRPKVAEGVGLEWVLAMRNELYEMEGLKVQYSNAAIE
jgi:hypothetical protein